MHSTDKDFPCHARPREQWCDRDGPGGFTGHTCIRKQPWSPNLREICAHYGVTAEDARLARDIIGDSEFRQADLVIAPDGDPYLYRWYVVPHNDRANVYFHIQVADDPKRPLHDHPWDNCSVILAGGYHEVLSKDHEHARSSWRGVGAVIPRQAHWAHRLELLDGVRYTMTLFSTGPKIRRWGFWYPDGWVDASEVCQFDGNISKHLRKGE